MAKPIHRNSGVPSKEAASNDGVSAPAATLDSLAPVRASRLAKILGGYTEFDGWRRLVCGASGWFLTVIAVGAVVVLLVPKLGEWHGHCGARLALVMSSILPPAYFWFEYHFVWLKAPFDQRPILDEYKLGQEMSRNLWLSFVAVILALYFK